MWIFTQLGFFSVVAHREKPGVLLVRARVRSDLETLAARAKKCPSVTELDDADYRFRAEFQKKDFSAIISKLVDDIDYDNFKDRVSKRQGYARASIYMKVWDTLRWAFNVPA